MVALKIVDIWQDLVSGVVEPLERQVVRGTQQVFYSQFSSILIQILSHFIQGVFLTGTPLKSYSMENLG